jgi:hypothetical protein
MNALNSDALQFYPTPEIQAQKMAVKVPSSATTILDPQAGEGALLDAVKEKYTSRYGGGTYKKLFAIELNENRQHVLVGKQYKLIGEDFLKFNDSNYKFDCIIMNPPFKNGIDHFLHAWNFLAPEGTIICLLNSTSVEKNTQKGKLFQKILSDSKAAVETQANVFSNAARKTDVETVLIVAKKTSQIEDRYSFLEEQWSQSLEQEKNDVANVNPNNDSALVKYNFIETIVARYNATKNAYADVFESYRKMAFLSPVSFDDKTIKAPANYHSFVEELQRKCWSEVFKETDLVNYMTQGMIEKFKELQESQGCREFTVNNIYKVLDIIMQNLKEIRESVVEEIFDYFTKHYKENRSHTEGWKTNDSYKVNKKVIIPRIFDMKDWFYFGHGIEQKLIDIEKALCLMLGRNYKDLAAKATKWRNSTPWESSISWACHDIDERKNRKYNKDFGKLHDSEFFTFRIYKKGTMHLFFKDEKIWEMFNLTAAKAKKWLGQKTQNEPTQGEQLEFDIA